MPQIIRVPGDGWEEEGEGWQSLMAEKIWEAVGDAKMEPETELWGVISVGFKRRRVKKSEEFRAGDVFNELTRCGRGICPTCFSGYQ